MRIRSLQTKVLAPIAAAVAAAALIVTAIGMAYQHRVVNQLVRERARSLSSITRHEISRVMRAGHSRELQPILDDLAENPDIAAVRILTDNGTVRRSTDRREVGKRLSRHAFQRKPLGDRVSERLVSGRVIDAMHSIEPITNRSTCQRCHGPDGHIGHLDVDIDMRRQYALMNHWSVVGGLVAIAQVAAVVGLSYPLFSLLVIRPARRLQRGMEQVRQHNLKVRLEPVGTTEWDALIGGFNTMVDRLREATAREEEARRAQLDRAEQLASVGELAAGLAHEIRNPLSGVKAAIEVLADDLPAEDSRREILRESGAELARIGQVTRDLLEYAKPSAPSLLPVDINGIVQDAILLTQPQAGKKGARLESTLAAGLPHVKADAAMVRQVLVNLILNALQALDGARDGEIVVTTEPTGDAVRCRVRDNGPGVPFGQNEAVFKPFFTTKARGTGLGLATSRRLIRLHGGELGVDNAGERGASFSFTLPLDSGDTAP